jgi:DNA-binding beta-propeller fold protein YncE
VASPVPEDLETFATLVIPPGPFGLASTGPDGIAFGKSGKLYVAEAATSTIVVLNSDGSVYARYEGPAASYDGSVPWANPANIAFNNQEGTLLVTNHASLVEPPIPDDLFIVFDVFVDDKSSPLP